MLPQFPSELKKHNARRGFESLGNLAGVLAILLVLGLAIGAIWFWVYLLTSTASGGWKVIIILVGILVGISGWWVPLFGWVFLIDPIERILEKLRGGPPWYRNPTDPSRYPGDWGERASEVPEQVAECLHTEEATLRRLGIPVPRCTVPISFSLTADEHDLKKGEYFPGRLCIEFPKFDFLRSLFFPLFDTGDRNQGRGAGYFIVADSKTLDAALHDLSTIGPHQLIQNYRGLWLNRNPNNLYLALQGSHFEFTSLDEFQKWVQYELPRLCSPSIITVPAGVS